MALPSESALLLHAQKNVKKEFCLGYVILFLPAKVLVEI